MSTLTDILASYVPQDFESKLLALVQGRKITTSDWLPGGVIRTMLVTTAWVLATGFASPGNQQFIDFAKDSLGFGVVQAFAHGGLLKFASLVSPDPSVQNPDGSYPAFGKSFLDSFADGVYNVQRAGGPLGGAGSESNDVLVARCVAKLERVGLSLLAANLDPYVAYATTRYAGAPLTKAIARVAILADLPTGVVIPILAYDDAPASVGDAALVNDFYHARCVPWSITCVTAPAVATGLAISCTAYVPARYATQAAGDVSAAILAYVNAAPIGGYPGLAAGAKGIAASEVVAAAFMAVPYLEDLRGLLLNGVTSDLVLTFTHVAVSAGITVTVVAT